MAVTTTYLATKKALYRLQELKAAMPALQAVLTKFSDKTIFPGTEGSELSTEYKKDVRAIVQKIISDYQLDAAIEANAAEAEVNSKIKGMPPAIAGIPVIIPTPIQAGVAEQSIIAAGVTATGQLNALLNEFLLITG